MQWTRRDVLVGAARFGAAAGLIPGACVRPSPQRVETEDAAVSVNDIHSQLNRTWVRRIERPPNVEALQEVVGGAARDHLAISVMGGRHAMGGQQFGTDTVLIDTGDLRGITAFDVENGLVEVGAGTEWPELMASLLDRQRGQPEPWGIVQKQTGADRLSLGGALAANVHGRGLIYQPIVQDVEAFTLIDARGEARRCSRRENAELFRLAIGGYGLFGVIASVRLRLAPRRKVERVVEVTDVREVAVRFDERIGEGYLFGDFQYSTDLGSDSLLRRGVFSCYRPVGPATPIAEGQQELVRDDWLNLIALGHLDRAKGFEQYAAYYQHTSGQIYWSDTHQLSTYIDDYHRTLGP